MDKWDILFGKNIQRAYRNIFGASDAKLNMDGKEVIADLKKFCRLDTSCASDDPCAISRIEGRREVMFHIMHKLHIDFEEVYKTDHNYDVFKDIEEL